MPPIYSGRYTAQQEEPFVVFLIGMRINRLFALHKWVPTAMAMNPMLQTLYKHPEKGFLGGETYVNGRGVLMVQYWRSLEALEEFARKPSEPHLGAWKRFNQAVGSDGSVGIWHETYAVTPGNWETIYVNMPEFGLAAATGHTPIGKKTETARERLNTGHPVVSQSEGAESGVCGGETQ